MDFAPDGPAVVLSPHPDDAVLSAWSVLRAPGELTVVNVFAGVPDVGLPRRADRLVRATDSRVHVRARLAEDREALELAGRTPLNLDFLDEQHRHTDPEAAELEAELTEQLPQASALYAPAGIRGDRDHELVRRRAGPGAAQRGAGRALRRAPAGRALRLAGVGHRR